MLRRLPRSRSLLRGVVALVAIGSVALGATACETKPGAAAFVGSDKITESDVGRYTSTTTVSDTSTGTTLSPRAAVLGALITSELFRQYLQAKGGLPSSEQLNSSRDAAFTLIAGSAISDADIAKQVARDGIKTAPYVSLVAEQIELEYFVVQRSKAANTADLSKAVAAVTPDPRVSPRYGTWDVSQFSLSGSSATPDYLQLSGSTGT